MLLLGALLAAAGLLAVRTIRTPASAAAGTRSQPAPPRVDVEEIGWMKLDLGPVPPVSMVGMNASALPAAYRNLYRLRPDRRVLYAFEEIDRVLARRRQPATLSLRFASGRWELRLGADDIGTLSEIPSFEEETHLLREFARRRVARYGRTWTAEEVPELSSLTPALDQGGITEIVSAVSELDRLAERWPDNSRILAAAARGTVWLVLLSYDTLQRKDPMVGHALGLLVLAQAAAPDTLREEEALLDLWMGYVAESERVGGSLADNDPVRAYVMADRVGLKAAASTANASARARYLYLLQSNSVLDRAPWFESFRDSPWGQEWGPTSLSLIVLLGGQTSYEAASLALARSVLEELSPSTSSNPPPSRGTWSGAASARGALDEYFDAAPEPPRAPIEAQTRKFEELLEKRVASSPGLYLDPESLRAMNRGMFYSALLNVATFRIDRRGSAETEVFTRAMGDPAPGTAAQIRDWLLEQAALDRSARIPDGIVARLESWDRIGTWPPHKIVQDVRGRTPSADDPIRRAMVRVMFRRLDTRPGGLEEAARSGRFQLLDLPLSERYLAGLNRENPVTGGDLVVYAAYWSRDSRKLRALADDARVTSSNRALAFRLLKDMGTVDSRALETGFRALVDERPLDTDLLDRFFDFCIAADDPKAAEEAIARWLNRKPPPDRDLLWAHFVAERARALARQKRWREARNTIESVVGTGKGDVLESASSILEEEGAWDEALAWAKRADESYPGNGRIQASVARILWRQRRYADAAEYLAAPGRVRPRSWTWQLPPAFVEAFEKADPHETQAAFTALGEKRIDAAALGQIARVVGIHGDHRLCFSLLQQIPSSARAEDAARVIWAAGELEKTDGAAAAAEWLRGQARDPHQLALVAFQFQRYDVLQVPFEDPARAKKVDEIELLRTAALLMTPGEDPTRQAELRRYFTDRKNSEWAPYALYMLDALPAPDFLSKPASEDALANIGWFAGLKAARLGRYEEASDWFEVAVHTDQMRMPPQAWAYEMLDRWKDQSKSLALFTPEDAFVVGKH